MKTLTLIGKVVLPTVLILLPVYVAVSGIPAEALTITDDATGGDCILSGTWDLATKTCTLTSDLMEPVAIVGNGITLDGGGHALIGAGAGDAVSINGLTGVEVRNLVIEGFGNGIVLYEVQDAIVDGNVVRGTGVGIFVNVRSAFNRLIRNTLEGNYVGLTITWGSHDNVVESNTFINNTYGANIGFGFANEIVNNAFVENATQLNSRGYANTIAANYWSDYDTPEEGCLDENADGLCDQPHMLTGAMDTMPGMTEDVDTAPPEVYVEATPAVLTNEGKFVNVLISGYADDSKSGVASVVITLVDEYGDYDQAIAGFGTVVTLKGKTRLKDYDGRVYTITATATDMRGNAATATATVFVPR